MAHVIQYSRSGCSFGPLLRSDTLRVLFCVSMGVAYILVVDRGLR